MGLWASQSEFHAGLEATDLLREARALRILVSVGSGLPPIQFEIIDGREVDAGLDKAGISRDKFDEVARDIADVVWAHVSGTAEDEFVSFRADADYFEDEDLEDPAIAREKYGEVGRRFPISDLRRRSWLKRTSKTHVPLSMTWEALAKHADADSQVPGGDAVPVGTVLVSGHSPSTQEDVEMTLTVDVEDVEHMIHCLNGLRTALDRLRRAG